MYKMKLLAALLMGGALVACGSSSSDSPTPPGPGPGPGNGNDNGNNNGGGGGEVRSSLDIQIEPMPLIERFDVGAFEGSDAVVAFFSPDYKMLNTPAENELEDGSTLVDPHPSFYYPTCCYWETDENDERTGNLIEDLNERWVVKDGMLAISNARMSIGQVLSDLTDPDKLDRKTDTSDSPEGASVTLGSWGELDLSSAYTISFCVNDSGQSGSGNSNFEVWVDNNSGGRSEESIHTSDSLLVRTETPQMGAGRRLNIEVPGDVYFADNDGGNVQTIGIIEALDGDSFPVGTAQSFLQLRVSSGGYAVISDFIIEYQDDEPVARETCAAVEDVYVPPPPPAVPGTARDNFPVTVEFGPDKDTFFAIGQADMEAGTFIANRSDLTTPFYSSASGRNDRVFIEEGTIRYGNALWTMGHLGGGNSSSDSVPRGDLDLTAPYIIEIEIESLPDTSGNFQVQIDNISGTGDTPPHGLAGRIVNIPVNQLEPGTLTINVPGEVVMNGAVVGSEIPDLIGTSTSHITFRCDSSCAPSLLVGEGGGVVLSGVTVEYAGEAPDDGSVGPWSADSFTLLGEPGVPVAGEIVSGDAAAATIQATGGQVSSSVHAFFFAHQTVEMSDFSFSARIASVDGADAGVGNTYRFGLMARTGVGAAQTSLSELDGWAEIGFYAQNDPVELTGSRGQLKSSDGQFSRSNVGELEVGHWVKIDIFDDGDDKRVVRSYSTDGQEWIQLNSATDFAATTEDDSWLVGLFAAAGDNEVTIEFDNIVIEAYEAP